MGTGEGKRVRGIGLVIVAVLSLVLAIGLVFDPALFRAVHPFPLVGLLLLSALVAIWVAWIDLR